MKLRLVVVLLLSSVAATEAASIDNSPKQSLLLKDSFVVRNSWHSLALYTTEDTRLLGEFSVKNRPGKPWKSIEAFDVTHDGELLVVGCSDGSIGAWHTQTGNLLWWDARSVTGLIGVYDLSISRNGAAFVVCNIVDKAIVCETATGRTIQTVAFPPNKTNIVSAALSPDASIGVLIELGEGLYFFDVSSGTLARTRVTGAWPVRFSSDGAWVACRSSNSGTDEQLRLVSVAERTLARDVGRFRRIGHVRPLADGTFLLCAWTPNRGGRDWSAGGYVYDPAMNQLDGLWKMNARTGVNHRTDFSPETLLGVCTDFRLVTVVAELGKGTIRTTIDNSSRSLPPTFGRAPAKPWNQVFLTIAIATVTLLLIGAAWWLRKRARHRS